MAADKGFMRKQCLNAFENEREHFRNKFKTQSRRIFMEVFRLRAEYTSKLFKRFYKNISRHNAGGQ